MLSSKCITWNAVPAFKIKKAQERKGKGEKKGGFMQLKNSNTSLEYLRQNP
jgi:hypothetical protein